MFIDKKYFMYLSVITLILYWFIMLYIPIPGIGQPDLSVPELNMAHYIDKNYDEFYGCKVGYDVTKVGENFEVKLTSNEFTTLKDILLDIRK